MGHDNRTESFGVATPHSPGRHAAEVLADLVKGNLVDAATFDQTKQGLLDSLSNNAAAPDTTKQGLAIMYATSQQIADRAELIGDLAAIGSPAAPVLAMLNQLGMESGFTHQELDTISESLHLSPKERLQTVSDWLAEKGRSDAEPSDLLATGESSRDGEGKPNYPFGRGAEKAILQSKESSMEEEKGENDNGDAGPEPSTLLATLNDSSQPPDMRLNAAKQLGDAAIPPLINLLRIPDQQGFAYAALNTLGGNSEFARDVHDAMRRLESNDPQLRNVAEDIRRSIEEPGSGSGHRARPGMHLPAVADGWLRNAIARCDSPSIMKAAAGREIMVIPLVTRRLGELRSGQKT